MDINLVTLRTIIRNLYARREVIALLGSSKARRSELRRRRLAQFQQGT